MAKKDKRFISIYEQNSFASSSQILVDRETGVNYLCHSNGVVGGLTVLLDREGKPIITTVFPDEE
ncbi:MAG: DUF6440 family protein [Coprobacillus sp.]